MGSVLRFPDRPPLRREGDDGRGRPDGGATIVILPAVRIQRHDAMPGQERPEPARPRKRRRPASRV